MESHQPLYVQYMAVRMFPTLYITSIIKPNFSLVYIYHTIAIAHVMQIRISLEYVWNLTNGKSIVFQSIAWYLYCTQDFIHYEDPVLQVWESPL